MKKCLSILLLFVIFSVKSQNTDNDNGFTEYYPIGIKPSFSYQSNMNKNEDILFDAKPVVYYSFFNNMRDRMQNSPHKRSDAAYITFQPHIRMYAENSKPVKMPSYRVLLGWQQLYKTPNNNFFAWAIESGHYSNGQSGCAFDHDSEDESDACVAIYQSITNETNLADLLNRTNGNFSTNTTKLSFNFRFNNLNQNDKPYKVHSFTASWELYHNRFLGLFDFGGYNDFDIKIYGRNRFGLGYEFIHTYESKFRYSLSQQIELIQGAHDSVEALRSESTITVYPFNKSMGIFASYVYGHDNYNYRFLDSGNQFVIGITWDWFTPFQIKRAEKIREKEAS